MRPTVPYAMVAINKTVQMPVIIPPIGKIRMFNPGTTNGAPDATTRVWIGGCKRDFVGVTTAAKTPDTKVASLEERVVFTISPVGSSPVNVTVGTRTFWRAALNMSAENQRQQTHCTYVPILVDSRSLLICPTKAYDCTNIGVVTRFCKASSSLGHEIKEVAPSSCLRFKEDALTADTVAPLYANPTCTFELAMLENPPVGAAIMYNRRSASKTPVVLSKNGRL